MTDQQPATPPGPATGDPGYGDSGYGHPAAGGPAYGDPGVAESTRDIAEVPAVEVISAVAVHLMSAAAVKLGLAEDGEDWKDLDEARRLITALAGLVTASREYLGYHAGPLRDGLQTLQRAFREASPEPDAPGEGPGERLTGPVR